jgi:crossover junction endodeoxyribonuclease RuvC
MKVIAIDPGYERMGVAIIEKDTNPTSLKLRRTGEVLVFSECFKTSPKISHEERLKLIGQEIENLIKKYKPDAMAIETLFFKNNQKTAMHVSEARGVMLYVASALGLSVKEFSPMEIKIAVTGYGKSEKEQVTEMVEKLIKINTDIKYDDEYDAIAVGLTYFACINQYYKK